MTRTFADPLERAKRVEGRRPAVVCGEHRLTHAELCERVQRLVGALRAMNLPDGSRVAVVGPNCHRYLELYLAVPAGGFVLVPLNARHTERELSYALEDSGASVLFATPDFRALEQVVDRFVELPDGYDSILAASDPGSWGSLREDDLAGLFYTGGTTGAAKGVMLTHGNLVANAYHFMACWPFSPQTRWLVLAPMFHAAGTIGVLATVWAGGSHVILPAFDPGAVLDAIERERVTATLVVPTMMAALADRAGAAPARGLLSEVAQPWQLAGGNLCPAPHCRRLSGCLAAAHLRPDGDRSDPDAPPGRTAVARQPAGSLLWEARNRDRATGRRSGRPTAAPAR